LTPQSENRGRPVRRTPAGRDFQLGGEGRVMLLEESVDDEGKRIEGAGEGEEGANPRAVGSMNHEDRKQEQPP
jgi:hypothetical protein